MHRRVPARLRGWLALADGGSAAEAPGRASDLVSAIEFAFGGPDGRVWQNLGRELHDAIGGGAGSETLEQEAGDALAFARHHLGGQLRVSVRDGDAGGQVLAVAVEGEPALARALALLVAGWLGAGDVKAGATQATVSEPIESVGPQSRLKCRVKGAAPASSPRATEPAVRRRRTA